MVILYAANVACLRDPGLYAAAYEAAPLWRREKADRCRMQRDKCLSLGAGLLLGEALRNAGYEAPSAVTYGENGKPFLADIPLSFSLSHSGEWVVCALADREVGCDVERVRPVRTAVAGRYFRPEEAATIAAAPTPDERYDRFFRYWTLKESFVKALGSGLRLPLSAFTIILGDPPTVAQSVDPREFCLFEVTGIPGCRCALCAEAPADPPLLRIVEIPAILAAKNG